MIKTATTLALAALVNAAICANTGADYTYVETVDSNTRTIAWSGCPNHFYGTGMNPNNPVKAATTYKIPKSPMLQPVGTTIDLSTQGGAIGITFAGEQIYSPYGGPTYGQTTNFATTAVKNEGDTFDMCGGHASSNNAVSYHIHIPPSCLLRQLSAQDNAHSPQIGWAFDGFPVYGPRGASGKMMKKCTIDNTAPCLDECGGIAAAYEGYNYRYHVQGPYNNGTDCSNPNSQMKPLDETVWTSYYPHTPICFRGCTPSGVTGLTFDKLIACAGGASAGSTSPKAVQAALAVNDKPVCSSYVGTGKKVWSSAPSTHSSHAGLLLAVVVIFLTL